MSKMDIKESDDEGERVKNSKRGEKDAAGQTTEGFRRDRDQTEEVHEDADDDDGRRRFRHAPHFCAGNEGLIYSWSGA